MTTLVTNVVVQDSTPRVWWDGGAKITAGEIYR